MPTRKSPESEQGPQTAVATAFAASARSGRPSRSRRRRSLRRLPPRGRYPARSRPRRRHAQHPPRQRSRRLHLRRGGRGRRGHPGAYSSYAPLRETRRSARFSSRRARSASTSRFPQTDGAELAGAFSPWIFRPRSTPFEPRARPPTTGGSASRGPDQHAVWMDQDREAGVTDDVVGDALGKTPRLP